MPTSTLAPERTSVPSRQCRHLCSGLLRQLRDIRDTGKSIGSVWRLSRDCRHEVCCGVGSPDTGRHISDRLDRQAPYSYRADHHVADFLDDKANIVFDGGCVLCSGFARFVAVRDTARCYRVIAAQSAVETSLYRQIGLDPVNYKTNLRIQNGKVSAKMRRSPG